MPPRISERGAGVLAKSLHSLDRPLNTAGAGRLRPGQRDARRAGGTLRRMGVRFTYSRWDGTQVGFELDADSILEEITDDLLYHGDLNNALRRMMQSGFRDRNGERLQGLREMLEKLRRRRARPARAARPRRRLRRHRPGAARHRRPGARAPSTTRSAQARDSGRPAPPGDDREHGQERSLELDMLPPDLAGQVRELQDYEFTSQEASQRFEELLDQLRQQLMQSYVNQMAGPGCRTSAPEQMQRMKDMLAALNEMLEQRERGEDPGVRGVHGALRRLLPREPADARRAARGDGAAHGRHAGHVELDDARAAGAAAAAHGRSCSRTWTCAGRWTSWASTCVRSSPRWAGTGPTTSRAWTRWASPRPST